MTKKIFFDIETTGLVPLYGNRVTCICAKDSDGKWFDEVDNNEFNLIMNFLEWLKKRSVNDYMLVSKNGKRFDVPFIVNRLVVDGISLHEDFFLLKYPHFDLQDVTKKWVSMDDMAHLLGCTCKNGNGLRAIALWESRKFEELLAYCKNDVNVIEEIYHKYLSLKKDGG